MNNKSVKTKTRKVDNIDKAKNILISIISFCILTSILLLFMASIITVQNIPHNVFPFISSIVVGISSFVSSFILAKLTKEKGLLNGVLLGIFLSVIISFIGLVLNGIQISTLMYIKTIIIIIMSSLGGVLGVNAKKRY